MRQPEIAIIIPACDEEDCIGPVLDEILATVDLERFVVAVGVNGSCDRTADVARERGVLVAETGTRGYGYGCEAAIRLTSSFFPSLRAYLFCAGDGAHDPREFPRLARAFEEGYEMVLGSRTRRIGNWPGMTFRHVSANAALGLWCGILGGRIFSDLGPLRIISRQLFDRLALREMTFGWTIEAQVAAAISGAAICEIPVMERRRLTGRQKVSGVNWRQTLWIGCSIVVAGFRTWRLRRALAAAPGFGLPSTDQQRPLP